MEKTDREKVINAITESESDFEKNLVYLSAGALTLSMGFIEKVIPFEKAFFKWLIIVSWIFLASTLLLNLASHLISAGNSSKTREEMDNGMDYKLLMKHLNCRNKSIRIINWISYILFALGIIFILLFSTLNLF